MVIRPIKEHLDFKVDALSKISSLINQGDCRVSIVTTFGKIEGAIAPKKKDSFNDLNDLMGVAIAEYSAYLEEQQSSEALQYNFIVLNNVVVSPFSGYNSIEYEQLVVYSDQIVAFSFLKDGVK
ncbi:hypothetical protein ACFQ5D_10930 [Paenibacillus farraposensis]|uniref:Roadblock/LC7 domain-containing protein n=1 Tax=Paenibacillus farraposensis TaxID=2807095 RepID=A0ABW4DF18_9BACL|nr:hypothetical protein [Paenibacillus farraposensis]MCC3380736.1 hypothetical protein [Paenibacillus farraposensis]